MRHPDGTYEPDPPATGRVRFALAILLWGLAAAVGGAAAILGPDAVVAALGRP